MPSLLLRFAGTGWSGASGTLAPPITVNRIARWDGNAWSTLASGMNSSVNALAMYAGVLYAAGDFTIAGGVTANRVAKWDGSTWSPLGSGINSSVYGLALLDSSLYAGGYFGEAGGKASTYLARALLSPTPFFIVTSNNSIESTNRRFYFTVSGPPGSNAVISASTDLQTWTPLATNQLTNGSLNFTDTLAPNFPSRFYRALLQP